MKCSDGLPCTPETCQCEWCKFPERKEFSELEKVKQT